MRIKWPVRTKVLVGLGLLLGMVAFLSSSGLYSTYSYRTLVKTLSGRVSELPLAAEMSAHVSDMRVTLSELRGLRLNNLSGLQPEFLSVRMRMARQEFLGQLASLEDALAEYRSLLDHKMRAAGSMADNQPERDAVRRIEVSLEHIYDLNREENWMLNDATLNQLERRVCELQVMAADLPTHLHTILRGFAAEVRGQYHALLLGLWTTSAIAALVFGLFVRLFYRWIFRPLGVLIRGSRKVASGDFNYQIELQTHDEMSELAEAMNDMTQRFRTIRDDLDRQVQDRTKQVVRNEQLASVGFLAAGVAHEINNPLASIAMCAESLDGRIDELLASPGDRDDERRSIVANYLGMIQSEAFRCKGITEKLLDFSRIGPPKRQDIDLRDLIEAVVEMIGHLGCYQGKVVELLAGPAVSASANAQEIKQVVLNLLTNALDSLAENGRVEIRLQSFDRMAEMSVVDNGCGMEGEVLERVFEPFFTRRRAGQGTGLGLSICYRIVSDHGGTLEAQSPGPGLGATFRVRLPLGAAKSNIGSPRRVA